MGRAKRRAGILSLLLWSALVIFNGCDDGPLVIEWPDTGPGDADADADDDGDIAEGGCRFDDECEDGVDCTQDVCDRSTGLCGHTPVHERCHDVSQCNGYEFCDSLLGCQPGLPFPGCNDHDACSIDICIEPLESDLIPECEHLPMDRDGDGHIDNHCVIEPGNPEAPIGDDCDDLDPLRYPGAGEFCFDLVDNDCDGEIDESDDDCTLQNDTCDTAVVLQPGRRIEGFTIGATAEDDTSCGWMSYPDVVYSFVVPEASDVTLEVWGLDFFWPYVSLQTICGDSSSELRCQSSGQYVRYFEREMEAGTYYVVVEGWDEGIFQLLLTIEEPTPPPEGDTCETAILLEDGESHSAELSDFSGDAPISCQWSSDFMDIVYQFTLEEASDVRFEVDSDGFTPYVAITETCGTSEGELFCDSANPMYRNLCAVPAGDYFLVVSGDRPGDLDVSFSLSEPGEPPTNETRDGAIDVSAGGSFSGSLRCSERDYDRPVCDYWANHDVVYTFTLDEPQDVSLNLTSTDGLSATLSLQSDCGLPTEELLCLRDTTISRVMPSLPAGTYFIHVAGEYQADFELVVDFGPPISACVEAEVITESGLVSGTTDGSADDFRTTCGNQGQGSDVAYTIDVPHGFDLFVEVTDAAFDTVLHLRRECDDPCSEVGCNDNIDSSTWFSELAISGLEAGSYSLIVDGWGWWDSGAFTIDVVITSNDPCHEPEEITESSMLSGTTCELQAFNLGSCGGDDAPEAVTAIVLAAESDVHVEVASATFDVALYLRGECDDAAGEVACDATAPTPTIDAAALPAGTYHLFVDGADVDACGAYDVDVTITEL